jgi:hypothetical protein
MNRIPFDRNEDGTLPAHAWPGGYPIAYLAADGGTICPDCANGRNGSLAYEARLDPERAQSLDHDWMLVDQYIHWEGPPEYCVHCGACIESAYGDPDDDEPRS